MKKYIIIVSVYDEENTQSYPLGGVFESEYDACKYLNTHLDEVKENHWTRGRVRGEGQYHEEQSMNGSFYAKDGYSGESLDIVIHELPVMKRMSNMSPQIIKADTAGFMVKFPNDDDVYYVGEKVGSGCVYQDKKAFHDRVGICYISQHGWLDEVGIDENVSDEMLTFMDEVGCACVALDSGYTFDDLYNEVEGWIGGELDEVQEDVLDDFTCYMTSVLFSNLVISDPCDIIEQYDVRTEYNNWLQTEVQDPRLTDKQRKELGYE